MVGLANMGCTCFMNAGLQCLSHLDPLVEYFLKGNYKEDAHHGGKLARAFADLQQNLWGSGEKVFEPKRLHATFNEQVGELFPLYEEHDAQEFLSFFIDGLHEDINRVQVRPPPLSEADQAQDEALCAKHGEEFAAALAWKRHLETSKSFLVDLLQGQQRSSLTCLDCGYQSRRFDPFLYLSLPVDRHTGTVGGALKSYLAEEILEGDDGWRCPNCWRQGEPSRRASKKIDLWKLPPVLVVHLKRFAFDRRTGGLKKITAHVKAPELLDLTAFCSSEQKFGATYSVSCVANHLGNIGGQGGHYTANCRVGRSGTWYEFNDRHVRQLDAGKSGVTNEAYVLFFVRVEARASLGPDSLGPPKGLPTRQTLTRPDQWPHVISTRASLVDGLLRARRLSGKAASQDDKELSELSELLESEDEAGSRRLQEASDAELAKTLQSHEWSTSLRKSRCSSIAEASVPGLLEGWLHKRGPCANYGWKPLWCVLRPGVLECFVAEDCVEKKSEILLPEAARAIPFTANDAPSDAIKHRRECQHGFVLDQQPSAGKDRRLFYFDAGSEEALHLWTRALEEAAGEAELPWKVAI